MALWGCWRAHARGASIAAAGAPTGGRAGSGRLLGAGRFAQRRDHRGGYAADAVMGAQDARPERSTLRPPGPWQILPGAASGQIDRVISRWPTCTRAGLPAALRIAAAGDARAASGIAWGRISSTIPGLPRMRCLCMASIFTSRPHSGWPCGVCFCTGCSPAGFAAACAARSTVGPKLGGASIGCGPV